MSIPVHVAILDLDVPVPTVYSTRGLYSSIFRRLLENAATRLNQSRSRPIAIHTSSWDILGGSYPPLASLQTTEPPSSSKSESDADPTNPLALPISAILLTGSAPAAYDTATHPWINPLAGYLTRIYNDFPHVKIFGSCFGHQILAQTLLSPPLKNELCPDGREMGLVPIALTEGFQASFPHVKSALPNGQMRLQMIHGDWVVPVSGARDPVALPAPWMNIGGSQACPVQGLYCPKRVLSYQGHFEFDTFVNVETCKEFGIRAGWDPALMVEWLKMIHLGKGKGEGDDDDDDDDDDDAKVAAEVVVLFFAGEDQA